MYMKNSPHGKNSESFRPVIMGLNGMVASGHPLASEAGINVMRNGGNAVDAALAVASTLSVVEPMMSGLGGDGYIMVYWKDTDSIEIINGTGAAPFKADPKLFKDTGIPSKGILSVSTPGLIHAWFDAYEKYASLELSTSFSDSIRIAKEGFPVSHYLSNAIGEDSMLCSFEDSQKIFTRNGVPLNPGEILVQKNLSETLKTLASEGRGAFYNGSIGKALVEFISKHEGLITQDDFSACTSRTELPISTTYNGYTVYESPPNSSGHILLQELNILENFDINNLNPHSPELIHLMIEAKKLAFSDRENYMSDPDFIDIPIEGMLSKKYATYLASLIDPSKSNNIINKTNPWDFQNKPPKKQNNTRKGASEESENTTCFVIVDSHGNAVCQLQSLQSSWGSGMIAGDTGILLNNRMTYWHLDPNHINYLQPGRRVRHTMNTVMVFDEKTKELKWVLGTPGADTQVQSNFQVLVNMINYGYNVTEAVEAPRWKDILSPTESNYPHSFANEVIMENRFSEQIISQLEQKGHQIRILDEWDGIVGREMIIQSDPITHTLHGAADPRYDGYAIGW